MTRRYATVLNAIRKVSHATSRPKKNCEMRDREETKSYSND